jgi:hypothetical protein
MILFPGLVGRYCTTTVYLSEDKVCYLTTILSQKISVSDKKEQLQKFENLNRIIRQL